MNYEQAQLFDKFLAAALQGLLSNPSCQQIPKEISDWAAIHAETLLEKRNLCVYGMTIGEHLKKVEDLEKWARDELRDKLNTTKT